MFVHVKYIYAIIYLYRFDCKCKRRPDHFKYLLLDNVSMILINKFFASYGKFYKSFILWKQFDIK